MAAPRLLAPLILLFAVLAFAPAHDSSASAGGELGDVDCSGAVTSTDAALLLQRVADLIPALPCDKLDDVDENGAVTSTDAAFVLQLVAALIPILPPPAIALANIPTHCPDQAPLTDGAIMATDILTRTTHDLYLPRGERITMGQELDAVLDLVRAAAPSVEDVRPHPTFALGEVHVYLPHRLSDPIYALLAGAPETVTLLSGDDAFDALNVRLRLVGFEPLLGIAGEGFAPFRLCFPFHLNVPIAAFTFDRLGEDITARERQVREGADVEGIEEGETWYLLFRDAPAPCPSGCAEQETFSFFTVTGDTVTQLEEAEALQDQRFLKMQCLARGGDHCNSPPS